MTDDPASQSGPPQPPATPPIHRNSSVLAVVPHYACEEWLGDCLASLSAQTRPLDGIVVIDDASAEPPIDIVAAFPDVTLVTARTNVGPYRLIQQVIDATAFDAYLFQDADDWSADDRLETLLADAEAHHAELIGSDYVMIDGTGVDARVHGFPRDVNAALAATPTAHALQHPTSLVARRLVSRLGGFASGMRFSGDAEFLRRAAHVATVINVTRPLYFRRNRTGSLTTSGATGHGTSARKVVLDALAARAHANADAVGRGEQPRLEPYSTRDPVELVHLCGPALGQERARALVPAVAGGPPRVRPSTGPAPVFVTGVDPAMTRGLIWSLAQHPGVVAVPDSAWVAALGRVADRADQLPGAGRPAARTGRVVGELDAIGATRDVVLDALATAVDQVVTGGTGRQWVATLPDDPAEIAAVTAVFPAGRLIHVTHRASGYAAGPEEWLDGTRAALGAEEWFCPDLILRIRQEDLLADPASASRACLALVGVDADERCTWPLRSFLASPPTDASTTTVPDELAGAVRALDVALHGPPPGERRRRAGVTAPTGEAAAPPAWADAARVAGERAPRALLQAAIPPGATVCVVSKGDADLVALDHATGWHLPRLADGTWAGYHPATSADAQAQLDELRRLGARYVFFPTWALWWLDHYDGLRRYLERVGRIVAAADPGGLLLELSDERLAGHLDLLAHVPADQRRALAERAERRAVLATRGDRLPPPAADALRPERPAASAAFPPLPARVTRPKVAVIAWSVSHNPVGRAYLLAELLARRYDVDLVGARFEQFGPGIWPPLEDAAVPIRSFRGGSFPEHHQRMMDVVESIDADALVVCKPRLPSVALGVLAKAARNRPLLLDVDDRELTFVGAGAGVDLDYVAERTASPAFLNPFGRMWTQYCETLVGHADHVLVSNPSLGAVYGGTVVPHGRDETRFDPARVDRGQARARYGFPDDARIVLFAGTPRRHKGIPRILAALAEIDDPRNRLCVIGATELDELRADLEPYQRWLQVLPYQPFSRLPELLAASDAVCVLQDPTDPVTHFQLPAKVTDALAMGVPCIVTPTGPLDDVIAAGGVVPTEGPLTATLARLLGDDAAARRVAERGRQYFLDNLSYGALLPRLATVLDGLLGAPPPLPAEYRRLAGFLSASFGDGEATRRAPAIAEPPRGARPWSIEATPSRAAAVAPGPRRAATTRPTRHGLRRDVADAEFDVVLCWKQNDTGIYGRRHDMLLSELGRSPRIGTVVQFDAPADVGALAGRRRADAPTHDDLVAERLHPRLGGTAAGAGLFQYTFGYDGDDPTWRDSHVDYVRAAVARHCSPNRRLVLWAYPKAYELPRLVHALEPDLVLSDLVDDHRTWAIPGSARWHEIDRHYAEMMELSDVVIANCEAVAAAFGGSGKPITVVPNGCEFPMRVDPGPPDELAGLPRPIVGYLGNLSSRLDVPLLARLAIELPHASVVLVGSAHAGTEALALAQHPNVHLLGPRPYEVAKRIAAGFDVAVIPHVDNAMTRAMNPLKAFVYAALGLPVVSTRVANLDQMAGLVTIADDHDAFVTAVVESAGRPAGPLGEAALRQLEANSWQRRFNQIMGLIDARDRLRVAS